MLLHQVFSFNSPVWFNVGTASPQQVSACFILAVDDSMDSILDWYKEEGLIFKGGSGSGVNLSRIRSSKELLSSGGTASGPVSFMRGADASAGTIKSGGATRRAAKMVILDVDHPDIEEFVTTKAREEDKIRALRDAGFDMDLGGADIVSVQYQNANNSVRVSDEFMRAVEHGEPFDLRARLDGSVIETVNARDLFGKIAQAAWECADPGLQYDDTINHWHTCPETGRITASNPCSEYLHLDNSSCNLASLNLMKFLRADGSFDTREVRQVGRVHHHRDGHLDLLRRLPDREDRRDHAGLPPARHRLRQPRRAADGDRSAVRLGGWPQRRRGDHVADDGHRLPPVGRVGRRRRPVRRLRPQRRGAQARDAPARRRERRDRRVRRCGRRRPGRGRRSSGRSGNKIGEKNGWRNSQASVLAPTGTIGLMMDCDTTGVEPDLALVKFKKLVGGGSMQIVNQTVPRALRSLGYQEEQVEAIVEYIAEHGHVVDAPGLRTEHYAVFDCAMGERSIAPMGHVRMMAAVQPFISGAISQDGEHAGVGDGR